MVQSLLEIVNWDDREKLECMEKTTVLQQAN